jgi:hypothetical protein
MVHSSEDPDLSANQGQPTEYIQGKNDVLSSSVLSILSEKIHKGKYAFLYLLVAYKYHPFECYPSLTFASPIGVTIHPNPSNAGGSARNQYIFYRRPSSDALAIGAHRKANVRQSHTPHPSQAFLWTRVIYTTNFMAAWRHAIRRNSNEDSLKKPPMEALCSVITTFPL